MTTMLNVAGKVTDEQGIVHDKVQIVVGDGKATLRGSNGQLIAERPGVVSVERSSRLVRDVTFADGSVWAVERGRAPCGCR